MGFGAGAINGLLDSAAVRVVEGHRVGGIGTREFGFNETTAAKTPGRRNSGSSEYLFESTARAEFRLESRAEFRVGRGLGGAHEVAAGEEAEGECVGR